MTATSIPASAFINVIPAVLGTGGNLAVLNGVMFTQDKSIPIGVAKPYFDSPSLQSWFGATATEAVLGGDYFAGFNGAQQLPGTLFVMQYNTTAVSAYVRGGSVAGLSLSQLQALSGVLTTVVDGVSSTSASINLSGATSFTNAAALIQTGVQGGTPASTATVTYDAQRAAFVITSATTGSASTMAFVTGSLAAGLNLTQATGAVLSQGAAIQTPAGAIAALIAATQNWVTCFTTWEPSTSDKVAFAAAINAQGQNYAYVGWDSDILVTQSPNASTSFGPLTATYNGRLGIWGTADKAAAFCGWVASVNYNQPRGRVDFAYRGQAGLNPDVTDLSIYNNVKANGYNAYCGIASWSQNFQNFQNGQISGNWKWADAYFNQIKINSDLQNALMVFRQNALAVPYAQRGYDSIRAACLGPIQSHLAFGSIVAGVTLSPSQYAAVNSAAGLNIADTLQTVGWYLQILDPGAVVRGNRGSPIMNLWYTDGGSVNVIQMTSTDVE